MTGAGSGERPGPAVLVKSRMTRVKVCGITTVEQARACAELGVDAIGVNLVPASVRRVDEETARAIVTVASLRSSAAAWEKTQMPPATRATWIRTEARPAEP